MLHMIYAKRKLKSEARRTRVGLWLKNPMTPRPGPQQSKSLSALDDKEKLTEFDSTINVGSLLNLPGDPISEDAWSTTLGLSPHTISPVDVMLTGGSASATDNDASKSNSQPKNIPGFVTKLYQY